MIGVVRVPVATGSRAKPGHDIVIPSKSCSVSTSLRNGEGPGVSKLRVGTATTSLPLTTSRDGELTPYLLIRIQVSWF